MIKKGNERLTITLTKKQVKWLRQNAKRLNMPVSQFIKWMLDRNLATLLRNQYDDYELKEIIRIASTPWITTFNENGEKVLLTRKMKKSLHDEKKDFSLNDETEEINEDEFPF